MAIVAASPPPAKYILLSMAIRRQTAVFDFICLENVPVVCAENLLLIAYKVKFDTIIKQHKGIMTKLLKPQVFKAA